MQLENISLFVQPRPGSSIRAAARDAVALANHLRLCVWFDFNGVRCLARVGDDPESIAEAYVEETQNNHPIKVAATRGKPMTNGGGMIDREKIANEIFDWMVRNHEIDCSTIEFEYLADNILALLRKVPFTVRVARECQHQFSIRQGINSETDCIYCHGTRTVEKEYCVEVEEKRPLDQWTLTDGNTIEQTGDGLWVKRRLLTVEEVTGDWELLKAIGNLMGPRIEGDNTHKLYDGRVLRLAERG